jgi:hypothetical protein
MKTPVLFIIYKRPEYTNLVFKEIRKVRPNKLFIAADGPKEGEESKCQEVRKVVEKVDWDCTVRTLFQDKNLGGKYGGYRAIDWFFSNVDEGIILEDDDLPDPTFFEYCETLLRFYREDSRIATISGDNFLFKEVSIPNSYYYSKYFHGWGWASWKRVWDLFDIDIKDWPEIRGTNWCGDFIDLPTEIDFWKGTLDRMYAGYPNAWDYQFSYCMWKRHMLNIIPADNLITNIGLEDSTHSMLCVNPMVNQKRFPMEFPLLHPSIVERHKQADIYTTRRFYR